MAKKAPSPLLQLPTVSVLLSRATEWKLIKVNPAKGVKPPVVKLKKSDVYSKDDLNVLFEKLKKNFTGRY